MNIVIVVTDITTWGGVERITLLLADALLGEGNKVCVLSLYKRNKKVKFDSGNIDIVYVLDEGYAFNLKNRVRSLVSIFKVLKQLKSHLKKQSDCIYIAQCFLPAALLWLWGKAKNTIVCEHFKYEIYNPIICFLRDNIYKRFLQIITLTPEDCNKFEKRLNNVRVIPNISPFETISRAELSSKKIISVGRLTYQKGYDYLLKAISYIKNDMVGWTIHVYGDGELRESLTDYSKELKVDDMVFFEGFSSDVQKEMLSSSIYVLTSRFEGLPLVLLEAMSCGLPIISFDCPEGPKALLQNGVGILVPPESPKEFSISLLELIRSKAKREELSDKSLEQSKKYSKTAILELWKNMFNELSLN